MVIVGNLPLTSFSYPPALPTWRRGFMDRSQLTREDPNKNTIIPEEAALRANPTSLSLGGGGGGGWID